MKITICCGEVEQTASQSSTGCYWVGVDYVWSVYNTLLWHSLVPTHYETFFTVVTVRLFVYIRVMLIAHTTFNVLKSTCGPTI